MGIYDRDYYRDGQRGYLDALVPEGRACKALIILHAVLFGLAFVSGPSLLELLALRPDDFVHGALWQVVSFSFVHAPGALWLFAWNMLFLWWFGSDLEQMYGTAEFALFYVLAAVLGGLAFVAASFALNTQSEALAFGPAGAITAILVLFAWHFPNHKVRLFFFLPIPIWLLVAAQVVGSLAIDPEMRHGGFAVNLTGALWASFYYKKQWRLSSFLQGVRNLRARPRTKLRVFEPEDDPREPVSVAAPKPQSPSVDEHLEAKVDEVLEKMARSGKESLTDHERQILLRASEIYRKKRT